MTREQLEQFAKPYEKPKAGPAAPGREIEVKSGEQAPVKPGTNLQGFGSQRIGTKNRSSGEAMPEESVGGGLNEGGRSEPPPGWRGKWEGYKTRIARSKVAARSRPAQPKPTGGK
jgi:hypothetical protein